MIDFDALDAETRCVALVGEFLRRWSEMEGTLNRALAVAMGLDDTMRLILCANIQLRDKIHVLRTIVDISSMTEDEKKKFKDKLEKIGQYSLMRNTMAHGNFAADKDGKGVVFFQVKAKGNFSNSERILSTQEFSAEYEKIEAFKNDATELMKALSGSKFSFDNNDDSWWWFNINGGAPMRRTASSALIHHLSQQILNDPDSNQAIPKKPQ